MRGDLVAEAAADVLRDEAELVEPHLHRRPHHDRGEAGELVVRVDRPLADAAVELDERAVALERRRVEAVEVELRDLDHAVGLGEGGVEVAPRVEARPHEVPVGVVVEHRRVGVLRLARVDERRQRLVVDLDELGRVARELARLGDDRDDRLADVAHLADREREVLDVRARRARDLEERIGERRDLLAGQRPVDAVDRLGRRDVDARDVRVRVRAAHEVEVAHPVPLDVVDEDALALQEALVLLALDALAAPALLHLDRCRRERRLAHLGHFATDLHGFDDVPVAGAAADVALQRLLDLVLGRARVLAQQRGRAHQHPRRAVAALERVVLVERLLQRRQLAVLAEPLDGLDARAVRLDGEQHAALHEHAVEDHRARAAVAGVAADVAAGQVEVVAQEMDEELARLDVALVGRPVDGDRDVHQRVAASLRGARREDLGEVRPVLARGVDVGRRHQVRAAHRVGHSLRRVGRDERPAPRRRSRARRELRR